MRTLLLVLCLLPALALAQTDQLVFFTGTEAAPDFGPFISTSVTFEQVVVHLGIRNPSRSCISAYEVDVLVEGTTVAPTWTAVGCGEKPECGTPPLQVQFTECRPVGPNEVFTLATFSCYVLSPTDQIWFSVRPVPDSADFPDSPGYISGTAEVATPLTNAWGDLWGMPIFAINGDEPQPAETSGWGRLKALYR